MTPGPLVSIVLPTYNGSRYLRQSVASCLAQTYEDFELIVVDDASTDRTPTIIAELAAADGRIRTVRNEPNRKLPASLNVGFGRARGDYLTWTSDDNLYRPHALAAMVAALEAEAAVDMVYTDVTLIDEAGNPIGSLEAGPPEDFGRRNVVGACFLYRRAVSETLGGYAEDLFLAEDYEYWLRASCRFRLQPLHQDLYLYRVHADSLTGQQRAGQERSSAAALERHIERLRLTFGRPRSVAYTRLVDHAASRGDFAAVRKYLMRAVLNSPGHVREAVQPAMVLRALVGPRLYLALRKWVRSRRPAGA
jgi:glycosyltransferase involved in cell wall biosynthesis